MIKDSKRSKNQDGTGRAKSGRTPTACTGCRRLKFRCDYNVPCGKCVTRGCSAICSNGSTGNEKGTRLALSSPEELYDRLQQLDSRKHELERAVQSLERSAGSMGVHADTHRVHPSTPARPKNILKVPFEFDPQLQFSSAVDDSFVDAFGTLTVRGDGESAFFGKTARAEYLMAVMAPCQLGTHKKAGLFNHIGESAFEGNQEEVGLRVLSMLPTLFEAIKLCEVYQIHGRYMYAPIPKDELIGEILTPVYQATSFEALPYHALGLLLTVFSLGALLDTDREPYSTEAQEYHHLSRVVLALHPQTTRWCITAYLHIAQYLIYSDCDYTDPNSAWMFSGHAVGLAHSIGLHIDSACWKLPQEDVERRRRLFWQLFVFDTWISFYFGRPPAMSSEFIHCPMPPDVDENVNVGSGDSMTFHTWTRQYTVLLRSIMNTAFGPKLPPYSTIISLDRRIREFPIPTNRRLSWDTTEAHAPAPLELDMQRWIITARKEMTLYHLHRPYFTQALQEMPTDLAKHRYLPSVVAIYRSAWRLIEALRVTFARAPQAIARFSLAWSQGLSAAIVMCLLVTRAPTSNMTPAALKELDAALNLFQDIAPLSPTVASFLGSIQKLHDKAHESVNHLPPQSLTFLTPPELDRLSGRTHLVAQTGARDAGDSGPSDSITHTNNITRASEKEKEDRVGPGFVADEGMHPVITQDLRNFAMETSTFDTSFFDFTPVSLPQPPMPDSCGPGVNPALTINGDIYGLLNTNLDNNGPGQHQFMPTLNMDGWLDFGGQQGL